MYFSTLNAFCQFIFYKNQPKYLKNTARGVIIKIESAPYPFKKHLESFMYQYTYEARSIFPNISLYLDKAYPFDVFPWTIIMAILAFAAVLLTAIGIKKARPLGIITAILQPLGVFSAMQMVIQYGTIDFSGLVMTRTSTVSMEDAMSKLRAAYAEVFLSEIYPKMFAFTLWSILLLAVTIVTLVYVILLFKAKKGKGLAVAALILLIIRFVCCQPIEMLSIVLGNGSITIQSAWDHFYRFAYFLPLLLIGIQGIVNLVAAKKSKPAPAIVTAQASATPTETKNDEAFSLDDIDDISAE